MVASPKDPPRLRAALNRPDASSARSVGTALVAAEFRKTSAKYWPSPITNSEATKFTPDVSEVILRVHQATDTVEEKADADNQSNVDLLLDDRGTGAIKSREGTPIMKVTCPAWNAL